ncbi:MULTISPECIES: precorrin-6A reductase [unclassified Fusibacter]|uniref:precorrin-6A reductase n=1 Tax=unclassified Fusibacter TaxID=2624464 RepID=UPI001010C37B|nr:MULTISPECIES: precorrin-6A reductase [unclassified Fusibacter]MCK8060513.1 precorrin-6A reductase [Fusibacter sp. A2]NPE20198.1 precorrin-6A reductase [Fusibacter sp. A1]RXV63408.1 precorrin-6A reductase [Fusibacter sp. A1]
MILIVGGTSDANRLAGGIAQNGDAYIMTVTTETGRKMAENCGIDAVVHPFTPEKIKRFILDHGVDVVLDASHPHAGEISRQLIEACCTMDILYIRYERKQTGLTEEGNQYVVDSMEDAASLAPTLAKRILVTGSKHAALWEATACTVIYRVLPTSEVLRELESLHVGMDRILAQKGPFSFDQNRTTLVDFDIDALVMKESGTTSLTGEKIRAARSLGIPCIVVRRPVIDYPNCYSTDEEILNVLEEVK